MSLTWRKEHVLYTFGYSRRRYEDLEPYMAGDALLLDVRFEPKSRNRFWHGPCLQEHFGDRYQQCRELGNLNYRDARYEPVQLSNAAVGLALLGELLSQRPVILLCVCPDARICHRRTITTAAMQRWPEVEVKHI